MAEELTRTDTADGTVERGGADDTAVSGQVAYDELLGAIRNHVEGAQQQVLRQAHAELVTLYWRIGRELLERQDQVRHWGGKGEVLSQLASDLRKAFPGMTGLSRPNLYKMRRFAAEWPENELVSQPVRQISWRHNMVLLEKLDGRDARLWYATKATERGWSSNRLLLEIQNDLRAKLGEASTNFELVLPDADSELAQEVLKSDYNLEFLGLLPGVRERELEDALIGKVAAVLQELGGPQWCFCARQKRLVVDGDEYFIDLLFFHRRLRRLIVVDLKIEDFKPEFAGKMGFYQAAVDAQLREDGEEPSIGLVLCTGGNETVVKYTLQGQQRPMGVSQYRLGDELPKDLREELPSEGALESGVQRALA